MNKDERNGRIEIIAKLLRHTDNTDLIKAIFSLVVRIA